MDDPRLDYFDGTVLYRDPADDMDYVGSEWDFRAPTLAEEHAFWHSQRDAGIIDAHATCPLDCGADDFHDADYED